MPMTPSIILFAFSLALALPALVFSSSSPPQFSPLAHHEALAGFSALSTPIPINPGNPNSVLLEKLREFGDIPALSVAVVNSTGLLFSEAFGFSEFDQNTGAGLNPTQPDSIFTLASISKTILALSCMILVDRGEFHLDMDINSILLAHALPPVKNPNIPEQIITLRHLLTHTAGINDSPFIVHLYEPFDGAFNNSLSTMIPSFLTPSGPFSIFLYSPNNWLNAPAGTHYQYSNWGTGLASLMIELVSGLPYYEFVRQELFNPLQLEDAAYRFADLSSWGMAHYCRNYAFNTSQPYLQSLYPHLTMTTIASTGYIGATPFSHQPYSIGMAKMSAPSIGRFLSLFLNKGAYAGKQIVSQGSIAEIQRIQFPEANPNVGIIYTWFQGFGINGQAGKKKFFGHNGSVFGVSTFALMDLDNGLGMVTLSTGDWSGFNQYNTQRVIAALSFIVSYLNAVFSPQTEN